MQLSRNVIVYGAQSGEDLHHTGVRSTLRAFCAVRMTIADARIQGKLVYLRCFHGLWYCRRNSVTQRLIRGSPNVLSSRNFSGKDAAKWVSQTFLTLNRRLNRRNCEKQSRKFLPANLLLREKIRLTLQPQSTEEAFRRTSNILLTDSVVPDRIANSASRL